MERGWRKGRGEEKQSMCPHAEGAQTSVLACDMEDQIVQHMTIQAVEASAGLIIWECIEVIPVMNYRPF